MAPKTPKGIVKTEKGIIMSQFGPAELAIRIKEENKMRGMLTAFITKHMKDGVDYGRIHVSKNCPNKFTPKDCKVTSHWSKPSLFKPGGEKVCSLFHLRARYHKDIETWEMAGSKPGLFCYLCELIDPSGAVAGEGRGACSSADKQGNDNNAIKIAEKRAKIDAVLSTGSLSDFFTQDLEDMNITDEPIYKSEKPVTPSKQVVTAHVVNSRDSKGSCVYCHTTGKFHRRDCPNYKAVEGIVAPRISPAKKVEIIVDNVSTSQPKVPKIDSIQERRIYSLAMAAGLDRTVVIDQIKEKYKISGILELTKAQADEMIKSLTP